MQEDTESSDDDTSEADSTAVSSNISSSSIEEYHCHECGRVFDTRGRRDYHRRRTHSERVRILGQLCYKTRSGGWACPVCTYSALSPTTLRIHIHKSHNVDNSSQNSPQQADAENRVSSQVCL